VFRVSGVTVTLLGSSEPWTGVSAPSLELPSTLGACWI
jgi:hypothetical protein